MNKQNILTGTLVVVLMVFAAMDAGADYSKDKELFEAGTAKLDSEFSARQDTALKQYSANLKSAEEMFQSRGDMESLLAVRAESERFSRSGEIEGAADIPAPIVSKIREYYYESVSRAENQKTRRLIALSKKWLAYLLQAKSEYTKLGKLDEATRFSAEAEKLSKEILAMEAGFAPDTETQLVECPLCKGIGYFLSDCTTCKGGKKCKSCAGKGQKKGLNGMIKCLVCSGTGKCRACDGAGSIKTPCSRCNGDKTIRVAAPKPEPETTVADAPEEKSAESPEEPSYGAVVEAELTEYITNMKSLYAMYNNKQIRTESFDTVQADPKKYVNVLLSSTVKLYEAFPRGVYVGTDQSGKNHTKLMPYSHSVGNSATRLLKNSGPGSSVKITYGLVNENNYTLLQIDGL